MTPKLDVIVLFAFATVHCTVKSRVFDTAGLKVLFDCCVVKPLESAPVLYVNVKLVIIVVPPTYTNVVSIFHACNTFKLPRERTPESNSVPLLVSLKRISVPFALSLKSPPEVY